MKNNLDEEAYKKKKPFKLSSRDLRASAIGWEIVLPIVAGPVAGYFIDRRFQTGVTFTLIFLGIGLITGILNLVRFVVSEFALIKETEENKKKNGGTHNKSH